MVFCVCVRACMRVCVCMRVWASVHIYTLTWCAILCAVISCDEQGCPRRCGGQGDLLSGSIGLFNYWAKQAEPRYAYLLVAIQPFWFSLSLFSRPLSLPSSLTLSLPPSFPLSLPLFLPPSLLPIRLDTLDGVTQSMLAAYTGCFLVKRCATLAYSKHGRAMLASDLVNEVEVASRELFGNEIW